MKSNGEHSHPHQVTVALQIRRNLFASGQPVGHANLRSFKKPQKYGQLSLEWRAGRALFENVTRDGDFYLYAGRSRVKVHSSLLRLRSQFFKKFLRENPHQKQVRLDGRFQSTLFSLRNLLYLQFTSFGGWSDGTEENFLLLVSALQIGVEITTLPALYDCSTAYSLELQNKRLSALTMDENKENNSPAEQQPENASRDDGQISLAVPNRQPLSPVQNALPGSNNDGDAG